MKKGFKTLAIIGLAGLLNLTACGKDKDGGGNVANTPVNPNGQCQAGYYPSQYGCLPQGPCQVGQVYYNNQCITPAPGQQGQVRFAATLQIVNRDVFEDFLEMASQGRCSNSSWVFGIYRCSYYSSLGYAIIQGATTVPVNGTQFTLTVGAGAREPGISGFEVQVATTYQAINSNQGFVLQDGSQFNFPNGRVRAVVNAGSMANNSFPVELSYEGQVFATTTVYRW